MTEKENMLSTTETLIPVKEAGNKSSEESAFL